MILSSQRSSVSTKSVRENESLYRLVVASLQVTVQAASSRSRAKPCSEFWLHLKSELLVAKSQRFSLQVSGALQRRPACGGTRGSQLTSGLGACPAPLALFTSSQDIFSCAVTAVRTKNPEPKSRAPSIARIMASLVYNGLSRSRKGPPFQVQIQTVQAKNKCSVWVYAAWG
jgi:hypothetical protein